MKFIGLALTNLFEQDGKTSFTLVHDNLQNNAVGSVQHRAVDFSRRAVVTNKRRDIQMVHHPVQEHNIVRRLDGNIHHGYPTKIWATSPVTGAANASKNCSDTVCMATTAVRSSF